MPLTKPPPMRFFLGLFTIIISGVFFYTGMKHDMQRASMHLAGRKIIRGTCQGYFAKVSIPGEGGIIDFEPQNPAEDDPQLVITGPRYFPWFPYTFVEGGYSTLVRPSNVVLTESKARKYFGGIPLQAIMGKSVIYDDTVEAHVSGIVKDSDRPGLDFTDFILSATFGQN